MNFDNYDYGSNTDQLQEDQPIKAPVEFDFTDALGIVKADKWVGANQTRRIATVDKAFEKIVEQAESDKSRKIKWNRLGGNKELVEMPLFHSDGSWTSQGKEWLGQQRNYLEAAANDETGGMVVNPLSGEFEIASHLAPLLGRKQKQFDPFKDFDDIKQDVESEVVDGKPRDFTYEAFLERVNQGKDPDSPSAIDPDNKAMREQFESRKRLNDFDPSTMGNTPFLMKEGVPIFNPKMLNEPTKIESAIETSELSVADKKMALINFRDTYNKLGAGIVNEVSDADDMQMHKMPLNAIADIFGVDRNNISKRFRDHMAQEGGKGSLYTFIKENEAEFSGEQFGWADKLNNAFWNANRSTGGGALWLLTAGQNKGVNQFLSDSARSSDSAFEGMGGVENYRVLGMDFTNKGMYDMAGQVASMLATGGASLALKGGIKAAGTVAGATAGSLVPKAGVLGAAAKGVMASDEAILAATKALAPNTAKNLTIKALRDPSAYIGGLQASGMSFGSTFNQVMEETGDYDLATKKANIEGISSGLSAFIATSVFNRIAPGAEKMMTGVEGSLSGSIASRIAFAKASGSSATRKATIKAFEDLATDEVTRKLLSKGMAEAADKAAKQAGLKGFGPAAGVVSEFFEESTDTALNDVISAVLDDSKTWTDTVWDNIGEKFSEYMAAGVMGAFGGAMGESVGGLTSFSKASREQRAKAVKEHAFAKWETIKGNIDSFGESEIADKDGKFRPIAEFLAWDGATSEEKSKALVNAARERTGLQISLEGRAVAPVVAKPPEAVEKPKEGASIMDDLFESRPKDENGNDMEWQEAKITYGPEHKLVLGGKEVTMQQVDLPRDEGVGALITDADGKKTHISAAKAKKMLEESKPLKKGLRVGASPEMKQRAAMLERFSADSNPAQYAKKNETSKQSTTVDADNKQIAPPSETRSRDSAPPQDDGDSGIAGDGGAKQTRQSDIGAPTSTTLIPAAQKLLDEKVSEERLIELASWKKESGSLDPSNEQKTLNQIAAKAVLKSQGKWDDANNSPLAQTKSETPAPVSTEAAPEVKDTEEDPPFRPVNDPEEIAYRKNKTIAWAKNTESERGSNVGRKTIFEKIAALFDSSPKTGNKEEVLERLKKFGAMGHVSGWLNEDAIREDYRSGLKYIRGEVADSKGSEQKKLLFERMGITPDEFLSFINDHGGEEAYVEFIKAHEMGHIASGHRGQKTINQGDLLDDQHMGWETEANHWALETLGFYEWRKQQPNKPNEKQTENQGDEAKGPQVGKIHRPANSNGLTGDIVAKFAKDGNSIIVADNETAANNEIKRQGLEGRPVLVVNAATASNRAAVEDAIEDFQSGDKQLGSEVESNTPAMVDPLMEDPTAPKFFADISSLDTEDKFGGKWYKSGDTYTYTPTQGKVLPIGLNSVVAIDGEPDAVLLLVGEKDGVYEFRKVDYKVMAKTLGEDFKGYGKFSKDWNDNRLKEAGRHIEAHLDKLFSGKLSEKEFDSMLRKIMAVVAPGVRLESIAFEKLENGEFFVARRTTPKDGDGNATGLAQTKIVLDRQAFMANLAKVFRGYRTGQDAFYNKLVGNEVARQLAAHVDEELTHVVGMKEFKDIEVIGLFDELVALSRKGKQKFISSVFNQIAARRVKGKTLDSFTEDEKYMVGAETLRALNQILTTGSWTEEQTNDAKRLLFALNEDAAEAKGPLKTVIELLRRYMLKIRRMLHMRLLMGQLPPNLQAMLKRQETAYVRANLFGDVDMIKDKNAQEKMEMARESLLSSRKMIGKVAMKNTGALVELKRIVKTLNLNIEDIIEIDYRNGTIRLIDDSKKAFNGMSFQDLIKRYEPDVNLEDINKALSELEMEGSVFAIMQDLGLAYRALEAARNLTPDLLPILDDSYGLSVSEGDEEGATRSDKEDAAETEKYRVMQMLVAAAPAFDNGSAFIKRKMAEVDSLAKNDSLVLSQMNLDVIAVVAELDLGVANDAIKLSRIAEMVKYSPGQEVMDLNMAAPDFRKNLLKRLHERATINSTDSLNYDGESLIGVHRILFGKRPDYKPFVSTRMKRREMLEDLEAFRLAQMTEAQADRLQAEQLTPEQVKSLKLLRDAQVESAIAAGQYEQYGSSAFVERARLRARRMRSEAGVNMEVANRLYQDYLTYTKALDDYNKLATTAIREMIGEESLDTKGFGMSHQDYNYNMDELVSQKPENVIQVQKDMLARRRGKMFSEAEYETVTPVRAGLPKEQSHSIAHGYPYKDVAWNVANKDKSMTLITVTQSDPITPWFPKKEGDQPPSDSFKVTALPTSSNPLFKRGILSSAAFRGNINAMQFLQMLDRGITGDTAERYMATLGYVSEVVENEDFDDIQYESIDRILPRYAVSRLYAFQKEELYLGSSNGKNRALGIKDLNKTFGSNLDKNHPDYKNSIQSLIDSIRDYATKLSRSTNPDLTINDIDGLQTLAGRSAPVINDRASEVLKYLAEFEAEVNSISYAIRTAGEKATRNEMVGFSSRLFALFNTKTNSAFENLDVAIRLANVSSEIARQEANSFKRIIPNVIREKTRTARDAGYASSELFRETRDSMIDPVTLTNMKWWINRFGKDSLASVGGTWAIDLMERAGRIGFGTAGEMLVTDAAWVWTQAPVFEFDSNGDVVMEPLLDEDGKPVMEFYIEDGLQKIQPAMKFKAKLDEFGEPLTELRQVHIDMSDDDAIAYLISEKDNAGRAPISSNMNEIGSSVKDAKIGRSSSESKQSPYEKSLRQMDVERQLQKKFITEAGLLIGLRIGVDKSADDAQDFLNRLLALDSDSSSYNDVLRDGLSGLFGIDPSNVGELIGKFKDFQQGIFEIKSAPITSRTEEFVTQKKLDLFSPSGTIAENRIDPFSFLMEMIEFKSRFERDLIDAARVGSVDLETGELISGGRGDFRLTEALRTLSNHATAGGQNPQLRDDLAAMNESMIRKGRKTLFSEVGLAQTNQEEAAVIAKMLHDESLGKGEVYLYDANTFAKMGDQGIISTNETINLILQNIPDAILYKPTKQTKAKNEAYFGTRFFVPMDGSPPVIYVGDTSNQEDNRVLIEQALGYLTRQKTAEADLIAQRLIQTASSIRLALSPITHLEELIRGLGNKADSIDNFIRQYTDELALANPASMDGLDEAKKAELSGMIRAYFMKMQDIGLINTAQKAELNKITALLNETSPEDSRNSYSTERSLLSDSDQRAVERERDYIRLMAADPINDSISLIAEVWSNPEAKRLLDRVMIGDNIVNTLDSLSDQTLARGIQAVKQMGESNPEDQTIADHFDSVNSQEVAQDNLNEEGSEDIDNRDVDTWADEYDKALEQARKEAGEQSDLEKPQELSTEDKEKFLALVPSANNIRRFFRARLFDKAEFGPMDDKLAAIVEDYSQNGGLSPADALLFNTLMDVVSVQKTLQAPVIVDNNSDVTPGREILGDLGTRDGANPIVGNNEGSKWRGRRGERAPFVGAWHTLMTGRQNGRTAPTLVFERKRYQKFAGGFLDRVPFINEIIQTQAEKSINEAVDNYNEAKHKNLPNFISYPRAYVDIPLTQEVYEQIGSYLPTGKLAAAEAEVRENIQKMFKLRENAERQRDKAKAVIEEFENRALENPLFERIQQWQFQGNVRSMIEAQILDEAYNTALEVKSAAGGDTRLEKLLNTYATKSRFQSDRYKEVFNDIQQDAIRLRQLIANADALIEAEQEATGEIVKDRGVVYYADPKIFLQQKLLNSNIQKLNQIVNKDMESVWRLVIEDDNNAKSVFSENSKKFIKINEVEDLFKFRFGMLEDDLTRMFSRDGLRNVFLRPLVEQAVGGFGRETSSLASREMQMPTKTTAKKKSKEIEAVRLQAKRQRRKMISRLVNMIKQGSTRNEIKMYLTRQLEGRFNALESNANSPFNDSFRAMLDEISMPSDALVEILRYDEGVKSTEEAARLTKAENVLLKSERLLAQMNDPNVTVKSGGYFSRLAFNNTSDALAGIHTHIGSDQSLNPLGGRHKVPITMTFVPEDALSPMVTEMTRKDELAAYRSKWNKEFKDAANPYEFYIRQQAISRALSDYAEKADVLHRAIKQQETYINNYNPAAIIQQVTDTMAIQDRLSQERINRIKADSEGVSHHAVAPDVVALLAVPEEQSFYSVSNVKELNKLADKAKQKGLELSKAIDEVKGYETRIAQAKNKGQFMQADKLGVLLVKAKANRDGIADDLKTIGKRRVALRAARRVSRHTIPENMKERRELVAHLVNDGEWLLLGSITAAQDLKNRFVVQSGKAQSGESMMRDIVLSSVPEEDESEDGTVHLQNRMGFTSVYRNEAWTHTDFTSPAWSLAANSTRESASKQFAARYSSNVVERANRRLAERRNDPLARAGDEDRKIDTNNTFVKKQLEMFEFYVESIALAYDRNTLSGETRKRVFDFLKTLADGKIAQSNDAAESVDLIDLYASVVSEIEGPEAMKLLIAGIVPLSGPARFSMKALHHHESKLRMTFMKTHIAQMEARRLHGYLEHGFDLKSGRNTHTNEFNKAKAKLEEKAKLLGLDSLQQSIPYVIASLKGLTKTRSASLAGNLSMWASDFQTGSRDLKQLFDSQNELAAGQKFGKIRKYFTAEHVDVIRDYAMVKEVYETIRPILRDVGTSPSGTDKNAHALELINKAIAALEEKIPANLQQASKDYSDTLGTTFKGLSDASELTLIMMSHPDATPDEGQAYQKWLHGGLRGDATFVTTVPLRYGHAANPKSIGKSFEPRQYKEDPLEEVGMMSLSLLGGPGKQARTRKDNEDAQTYRPINLNGLSGTIALLDDTLYRLNVTPTYSILRKIVGKEEVNQRNQGEVVGSKVMAKLGDSPEGEIARKWRVALGAISEEMDIKVANDMKFGVANTAFSETLNYLSSLMMVRSLFSFQQFWNQSGPSVLGYIVKKSVTGNYKDAIQMVRLLSKIIASKAGGDSQFNDEAKQFVANVATWVNFRGADGIDKLDQLRRKQVRHGAGLGKKWSGYALNQITNLGEKSLDFSIAKVERALSRSIFITELLAELRWMEKNGQIEKAPKDEMELIGRKDFKNIPMEAVQYAEAKVSDHMGVADQAKKAMPFQNLTRSPSWNALIRTISRFSNHQASTSSGMAAMLPMIWKAETGEDGKLTIGGQRARQEAIENITGTVIQNSLFHIMKLKVLVPIVLSVIYGMGDDDDEEAQVRAQEMADKLMAPDEEGNPIVNAAKAVIFGKQSQFFRDEKTPEAAAASAYASLGSSIVSEIIPMAHPLTAAFGFYPAHFAFKAAITNQLIQDATAKMTGLDSAQSRWEDDAVYIYEREEGGVQTAMGMTAPSSVVYDLGAAAALSTEAAFAEESNVLDIIAYMISEVVPVTRELRGRLKQKVEESVWEQRSEDNR